MKRKVILSVAFLLAMVLTLSILPFASAATKAQNGLQYELTTDKEAYASGETIQVELNVANSNEQDLTVAYEVILPEGMELAVADRGYLQVAAGGQAASDFSVQTAAKGADELPSTGDSFPLEVVAVLLVLSAVGCAVFFKKTRFVAFMLLCVMLIGVVEPALVNAAVAETRLTSVDTAMTYPEDAYQVEYPEEISEELHEKQLAEQELQLLGEQDDEFIGSVELDQFELAHNIVVDNQVVTIKVVGTVSVADATEEAASVKALGSVSLKPVTILGKTKFKLTWSKVPGATHYEVWHTSGSTYVKRATCVGTTWTTNYGVAGVINTYKVRAITKSGNTITAKGPYSTRTCYGMAQPTMSSVAHTSSSSEDVRVSWNKGSFCTGYYVYRSFTGATGSYSLIGKSTTTSFVDKYRNGYYKVRPYYTSSQTGITYSGPATGVKNMPTQHRALIIGQTYPTWNTTVYDGRSFDATSMKTLFTESYSSLFRSLDVKLQNNLTANEILKAIKTSFQRAKGNDISIFYFSGCGRSNAICGVDAGEYSGTIGCLSPSQLKAALDAVPGQKVVILDCSYSGSFIGRDSSDFSSAASDINHWQSFNSAFLAEFSTTQKNNLAANDYYVLTSCYSSQKSHGDLFSEVFPDAYPRAASIFTRAILFGSGLSINEYASSGVPLYADSNNDQQISLHELYMHTVRQTAELLDEYHWFAYDYSQITGAPYSEWGKSYPDIQVYPIQSSFIIWGK